MNQDIIEYLEGYWVKCEDVRKNFWYCNGTDTGEMVFYPSTNILVLRPDPLVDGYEVQIQDLSHLIQLEALL